MRRFWLLVMLGVAACGGDDGKEPGDTDDDVPTDQDVGPGAVTVVVEPATVSIAEGATGSVRFTTTRTGQAAEGDVAYSVSGVPNGIGSTITGDDLTLQVPYFAQNRSTTISVTATANNGRKNTTSFTLTVTPPVPVDVRGSIIAFETGLPIENLSGAVELAIWGRNATEPTVVTLSDATFAFDDVTPPYDVLVTFAITTTSRHLYLGLGRPDPTLTYYGYSTGRVAQASHGFTVGYSDPSSVGYDSLAYDVSCANNASDAASIQGTTNAEPRGPVSATPTACTVRQLAFDIGASFPEDYASLQSATQTVNLTDGATDDLRFVAGAASNHVVPVTFTPAPDAQPLLAFQWLLDGQRSVLYFADEVLGALTQVVVPGDAAVTTGVCLSAANAQLTYNLLNGGGTTACRLAPPTAASLDFGTLVKASSPGAPVGVTAHGNVAFPALGGFGAYIIDKVSPPEEETFVFTNGPINAQTMARHGLAFDSQPTMYEWRSFKLNGISSIDVFAGADVTTHGFVSRQSGYSVSGASGFQVTN